MYLSEDIRLNILEYSPDINLKVSDNALLERIQVIDPSFCISNAIEDFNRQKEDRNDPMYPLFSFLCKSKWLYISDIYGDMISLNESPINHEELHSFISDNYPDASIRIFNEPEEQGNNVVIYGIDANALYRLFVTYKNRYDPLSYKFDINIWSFYTRMYVMREESEFRYHMIEHDLLHLYDRYIYSSDNISFSLQEQLYMAIERINRYKQIKAKIESMKLSPAYDLYLQMKDKAYYMYMMDDYLDVGIYTDLPLIFPEGIIVDTTYDSESKYRTEYTLSGDLSIMSDVALLYVLHDDYNYNFDDSIRIN